ncbi:hypothetical protein [Vulcanisaeta souniana]|uniref:hypothetical protein n=1 Tax=Vulcanisaeta souniana TaxID=164452 RepID=UPI0006CF77BC|nr:hypothetical protein [Vulcanisaeta souniana]
MALVIATLLIANHAMAFFATTVRSLYGGYSITAYAGTNGVTIVKHNAVTGDTVYNVDPTSNGYKATYYAINNHITTTPRQVTTPVNTQVVTKTVTITNTITNTITKYYYPIITYTVQYLMTWMTPSGMCENGLCGLNPSLLMPTMPPREGHGNGNNGNKWGGHFIYIPAVTAVFNYTGFGLQVGVKLVPQITGWTSSSSTSTSTSSFTTTSQSVQTITRDITSTIPSQPPTAYFSYGGGGSNNPPTPSTAIVKYPVYSTNLDLPTVLVKTGGLWDSACA